VSPIPYDPTLPRIMPVNAQPGGTPTAAPTLARAGTQTPVPSTTNGGPAAAPSSPARATAQPDLTPKPYVPPGSEPSAAQSELTRLQKTGPGYSQVKNPFLRGLATVGSVAAGFFPRVAPLIPGTEAHHGLELARAGNAVRQEQQAKTAQEESALHGAQAKNQEAEAKEHEQQAENLQHPQAKEEMEGKTVTTAGGIFQWNPATRKYDVKVGDAPEKEEKTPTHFFDKDGNAWLLKPDGSAVPVHGPSGQQLQGGKETPTKTEVRNVMKNGKPHQVLFNSETGEEMRDLGETGEKPPTVNVNAETSALDRESSRFAKTHEANVKAANDQLEKIVEARALLTTGNAESQALAVPKVLTALISGQGTGVRITQAELNQIAAARGIQGDFQAWVQRISSGKKLTPDQTSQLVGVLDAAQQRLEQKREIANKALDTINSAGSRSDIVKADQDARKALAEFEKGGSAATDPKLKAYADQYFGGDIKKAQAAIDAQRRGK
jgi:hypothetical protein